MGKGFFIYFSRLTGAGRRRMSVCVCVCENTHIGVLVVVSLNQLNSCEGGDLMGLKRARVVWNCS